MWLTLLVLLLLLLLLLQAYLQGDDAEEIKDAPGLTGAGSSTTPSFN
jgi:hypothetical protein